ncbi:myosin heavy chain, non-muscle-like [Drosophila miranda]|uniref:myosin heavy chain, non-muscle-like n=1 Tax=Drosophila miranda TaxID=7229 RepID=UPI00143F2E49|nr:myosin heavy chain, non-muscle-like [Drosophila miranda]
MSDEVDRNDPELKYLSVERNQYNDPATQAEWTQKRLVWVPHENQGMHCCLHFSATWNAIIAFRQ